MNRSLLLFLAITLLTQSCSTQIQNTKTDDMKPNAELENTRWKLTSLPGMKELPPFQKDTWIQFVLNSTNFRGNAGCNNMSGTFKKGAVNKLSVGPVAMTRMMCQKLMNRRWQMLPFVVYLPNESFTDPDLPDVSGPLRWCPAYQWL